MLGLVPAACLVAWQVVVAAPADAGGGGGLDPTFGAGGRVVTDIAGNAEEALAVIVQPDGKIVAAGGADESSTNALDDFALVRYRSDGRLDLSFGVHGKVQVDFTGVGGDDEVRALAVQADGKLVAAGSGAGDWALARFTPRGRPDESFGDGGKVRGDPGQVRALAVQADGKLVAAGFIGSRFALARYNPDGSLDPSFGGTGTVLTDFPPGLFAEAHAVAVQPDGRIVAAGSAATAAFALARYNPDGSLDPTFGANGTVTTEFPAFFIEANGLVLQPDGKLVVAGGVLGFDLAGAFALARYNPDGSLDPGFGTGGTVTTDFAGTGTANALILQANGRLLAAGIADPGTGTGFDFAMARYRNDGSLDPNFGTGGTLTTDFGGNDRAWAMARQPDGKPVLAGSPNNPGFGSDFALARYRTH